MLVAAPNQQSYTPAFTVRKLEGKVKRTFLKRDGKGTTTPVETEVDAGWLITFPLKGNSIRVWDEQELKRLGFDKTIKLVDEDGIVGGTIPNPINLVKG